MSLEEIKQKQAFLTAQCPRPLELSEAEAAKLPIHVDKCGTTGRRVLIIHGGVQGNAGGGPNTFAKQKELCNHGWQVEIVDRPGFGESPSRGVDDMERDAVWIADMLGDGAHLVGHSWGGAEVLLAAARRPQAVHSLTIIEPALQALAAASADGDSKSGAAGAMAAQTDGLVLNASTPAEYMRGFLTFLNIGGALGKIDQETMTRLGCSMLQAKMASPAAFQQAAATIAKAAIPVLAISGGWSESIDEVTKKVAELTGGRYTLISSTGHYPMLENSDEFNRVVEKFWQENAPA